MTVTLCQCCNEGHDKCSCASMCSTDNSGYCVIHCPMCGTDTHSDSDQR